MSGIVKGDVLTSSRLSPSAGGVESGTKMIFNQTAAPTGWTKSTSANDVALRVVSGTGGSVAFETAFASQTISTHTLSTAEIPGHTHTALTLGGSGTDWAAQGTGGARDQTQTTSSTGGGGAHGHGSIDLNVSFVDVIIATKD